MAAAYPRRDPDLVSSHNDLNPGNVLFQKKRAWIVDWEAAFAADRYVDIAAVANFFATDTDEVEMVLESYFGDALNDYHRERCFLMQQVNRIFYAMVLLNFAAAMRPETRVTATDFKLAKLSGSRREMAQPGGNKVRFACALLNDALQDFESPRFAKAVALVKKRTQRRLHVKAGPQGHKK